MRTKSLLVILLLGLIPVNSGGDPPKEISVSFAVEEPLWTVYFGDDTGWIETEGLKKMCSVLKEYFAFLDFQPGQSEYMLEIALKNLDQTTGAPGPTNDVIFEMLMSRRIPDSDEPEKIETLFWIFKSSEFYDLPLGEKEGFLTQVMSSFEEYVKDNTNMIVTNLFSKVPLADQAWLAETGKKWYLPLSCRLLCVEVDSEFLIETKIVDLSEIRIEKYPTRLVGVTMGEVPGVPEVYWDGKIITVPVDPQITMESGVATLVWIRKYVPPKPGGLTLSSPLELVIKDEEERR